MRLRLALTAAVLLVATAACTDSPKASSATGATVGTEAPTTTTTNPYAVPATIDAAYVNRVLAGLDVGVGDVVRLVVSTKFIPREAYDRLRGLYANDAILQLKIDGLQADIRRGLTSYRQPPGNKKSEVAEILSKTSSCIFARVNRDFSAVSNSPNPELSTHWVAIRPLDRARDPFGYNLTGWAFIYDGFESGIRPPASDPCAAP